MLRGQLSFREGARMHRGRLHVAGDGFEVGRAGRGGQASGQLTATILPEAEIALTARVDCLTALRNMIKEVGLIL